MGCFGNEPMVCCLIWERREVEAGWEECDKEADDEEDEFEVEEVVAGFGGEGMT